MTQDQSVPNLDNMSNPKPADKPASARLCAARAVQHILRDQEQLETALSRQADYGRLEARDRAFARLITATVFRRMGQIDAALKPFLTRTPAPLPLAVLRTGAAQLLFLKTPVHAAVGESVGLLKRSSKTRAYAGMVNAVLRKVASEGPKLAANTPPSANLPGWVRASWESAYGKPAMRRMARQLAQDPPLDIHVRGDAAEWAEKLGGSVLSPWCVRLSSAGHVPDLPGYEDGHWWVQDLASSFPVQAAAHTLGGLSGLRVLDLCAAPGGKTLQLASLGATVTALDKSPERMERVSENLSRTRLVADAVEADAIAWIAASDQTFDLVVLDAPCSATGTFRRHPDVLYNRTPKDVAALARLQKRLIQSASHAIKPGGFLLYCTCSLQPEEGERQADWIDKNMPDLTQVAFKTPDMPSADNFLTKKGYTRILPHLLGEKGGVDGFYAILLQKKI